MGNNDKHHVWQSLMDAAYDRWQNGDLKNVSPEVFMNSISLAQREAVMLGNMNYQVENGGWEQWVDNGYCIHAHDLMDVLENIGTENAKTTITMIRDIVPFIDFNIRTKAWSANRWICEENIEIVETDCPDCSGDDSSCRICEGKGYIEEEETEEYCEGHDIARNNDKKYYKLNHDLMDEIENYLKSEYPQ